MTRKAILSCQLRNQQSYSDYTPLPGWTGTAGKTNLFLDRRGFAADPLLCGIIGLTVCLAAIQISWLIHGGYSQPLGPQFFPLVSAVMLTATLTVSVLSLIIGTFLAFGRYRALGDATSWWIGMGLAAFSLAMIFRVLSFPFVPGGKALIGQSPNSAAWLVMFASTVLATCLLAANMQSRGVPTVKLRLPVAVWLSLAAILYFAFIVLGDRLPTLVASTGAFTPLQLGWQSWNVILLGSGAVVATRRYLLLGDLLPAYVGFSLVTLAFAHLWSASGGNRYSAISAAAGFLLPGGYLVMVFGLLSDYISLLSRERQKSGELRTRSTELTAILREIPDAVFVVDVHGLVRFASERALSLIGYAETDYSQGCSSSPGGSFGPFKIDAQRLANLHAPLLRAANGEGLNSEELQFLQPRQNQPIWLLVSCSPLTDENHLVVGGLLVATDITTRKQGEEHIRELNGQLDDRIKELQATEAALRRSNDDLKQFAYVASHDLREPLRNVSTYAELLARAYATSTLDQYADMCISVLVSAPKRMEALITGLLTYARVTSDPGFDAKLTDLNVAFAQAVANLRILILEAEATITQDNLPSLWASPFQIVQVFQNLLENSLNFRRLNVPTIIYVSATPADHEWLFCVRDNGEGFKAEYAENIFGIFKRLRTADLPGSGIGLPICKAIVERHGGRIYAQGRPGEGAAIYFSLPNQHA